MQRWLFSNSGGEKLLANGSCMNFKRQLIYLREIYKRIILNHDNSKQIDLFSLKKINICYREYLGDTLHMSPNYCLDILIDYK